MAIKVLILTPVRSFGELIQQALEETGLYRATLMHDKNQVLVNVKTQKYPVIILDFDLDLKPADLLELLVSTDPNIRIIAMKDKNSDGEHIKPGPHLAKLLDDTFYLPDLLDAIEDETADLKTSVSHTEETRPGFFPSSIQTEIETTNQNPPPAWLEDSTKAAQHLSQQHLDIPIQAALITSKGELWAYAGGLPQSTGKELAHFIRQYWSEDGDSDLARYVRLESTSKEFLLYATSLGNATVLALAFDIEVPFSTIRSRMYDLVNRLTTPITENISTEAPSKTPNQQQISGHQPGVLLPAAPDTEHLGTDTTRPESHDENWPNQELDPRQDTLSKALDLTQDFPSDQDFTPPNTSDPPITNTETPPTSIKPDFHDNQAGSALNSQHSLNHPTSTIDWDQPITLAEGIWKGDWTDPMAETQPVAVQIQSVWLDPSPSSTGLPTDFFDSTIPNFTKETLPTPVPDYLKDTLPSVVEDTSFVLALEQPNHREYQVSQSDLNPFTYAFVLVPRMPQHLLIGELAALLNKCVLQLGKNSRWQIIHISVRPNHILWVASIPPDASPGNIVKTLRDHTSQKIFTRFPNLESKEFAGDFWAPGYLIQNGRDPLSHHLVEDFIDKTRQQG